IGSGADDHGTVKCRSANGRGADPPPPRLDAGWSVSAGSKVFSLRLREGGRPQRAGSLRLGCGCYGAERRRETTTMNANCRWVCVLVCGLFLLQGPVAEVRAAIAIGQITDINNSGVGFGNVNVFSNPPIGVNDTGVYLNNDVVVYTLTGPSASNGGGLAVSISNGENGITQTAPPPHPGQPAGTPNLDANNTVAAHSVFTTIGNGSGRLENGNAIRLSMWMRQDPTNPVVKQPSVEPVVKIELWKQDLSGVADFNSVAFPGAGD